MVNPPLLTFQDMVTCTIVAIPASLYFSNDLLPFHSTFVNKDLVSFLTLSAAIFDVLLPHLFLLSFLFSWFLIFWFPFVLLLCVICFSYSFFNFQIQMSHNIFFIWFKFMYLSNFLSSFFLCLLYLNLSPFVSYLIFHFSSKTIWM